MPEAVRSKQTTHSQCLYLGTRLHNVHLLRTSKEYARFVGAFFSHHVVRKARVDNGIVAFLYKKEGKFYKRCCVMQPRPEAIADRFQAVVIDVMHQGW